MKLPPPPGPLRTKRSRLKRVVLAGGLGLMATLTLAEIALRLTPMPAALNAEFIGSTEFLDRTGEPLRVMLVDERRYTRRCALGQISPRVIEATISAEDKRFRHHGGIDLRALARAVVSAVRPGATTSGASTITQQLVKLVQPGPRTIRQKITEMWLALRVERAWSKDRILEEYLNRLDYGNLQIGIASASGYYFGKPPSDLSAAEAAFLAGLPKAPTRLDPHANFSGAQDRQRWILGRMQEDGRLSAEDRERAVKEPLQLAPGDRAFAAPHFVDLLLQRRGLLPPEGGPVKTTLDLALNRFATRCLEDQLARIVDKHATNGAAVVIDNATGDVLALAVAGDYFRPGSGQINAAWMIRSPGSTVKPFTYELALERGANPSTVVPDVPTDFATDSGLYRPNNYNHRFYGPVSLRFSLGNSLNVGAIRTLELAGGPEVLQQRLIELGLGTLHHPTEYYGLGLTLGNGEVRLLEMTSAFATLGRLGIQRPYRLLLHEGQNVARGRRVLDARATWLVTDMLSDNVARAASFGLDSYLAFDFPVACKTGTSSDYRDNWVFGFTPEFTVGVWVGNVDGSTMHGITGVTGAAPVMHEIVEHLHQQRGSTAFVRPDGILEATIHPLTGRSVAETQPGALREKCLWPPEPSRPGDFDAQGRVVLSPEYAPWLASPQNGLGNLATSATAGTDLRIINPPPGATYFLDPDLPTNTQWIALRAEAVGAVKWSSDSLPCEAAGTRQRAQLRAGRHTISALDAATGRKVETWIDVREL